MAFPCSTTVWSRERWLRRPSAFARATSTATVAAVAFALLAANGRAATPPAATGDPAYGVRDALIAAGVAPDDANAAQSAATAQPATSDAAATDQTATSDATATQQQPTNVVVSVRINSPGDNGPISQTNVVVAGSGASNAASTAQARDPDTAAAAPAAAAATDQQAAATATATQDEAGNLVVVVRIDSPGDNGAVDQANVAGAGATSGNTSSTTQGAPAPGAAARPAVVQPQPAAPAATSSRPRTRKRRPVEHTAAPRDRAPAPVDREPAAASSTRSPSYDHSAPTAAASPEPAPKAAAAHARHRAGAPVRNHARTGSGAEKAPALRAADPVLAGLAGRAVDAFGAIAPRRYGAAAGRESADVSSAVVLTLLALLGAVVAFLFWPQLGAWLRLSDPRNRIP